MQLPDKNNRLKLSHSKRSLPVGLSSVAQRAKEEALAKNGPIPLLKSKAP